MPSRAIIALLVMLGLNAPAQGAHQMHDDADATVAILMFDGVQIIDFAAPYEVFGQARFNVYTVSADGGTVDTAMGLSVNVDHGFEDAPVADIVLVPGGSVDEVRKHEPTLAWLRKRSADSDQVLSVCTGSFILADAGLLDGSKATTFHRAFDDFERQYPDVTLIRDQRWVDSGKMVTSAGLASGIDASLHLVAKRLGERRARAIALHLEYDWSPEQGFVRGLLADRHVRMPAQGFEFPEGTEIDSVMQVGDQEYWEIDYEVDSSWGPEELLAHIRKAADGDPTLILLESDSSLTTSWRYESKHGGEWVLQLQADRKTGERSYRVRAKLSPAS